MELKEIIFQLIYANDGKWTWYQLERGLTAKGVGGQSNTMVLIHELINEGLISEKEDKRYPHSLYCVTELGRKKALRKST
jgi:DNA-binding HxlR family transcriptional regulator